MAYQQEDKNNTEQLTPNQLTFRGIIEKLSGNENGADLALYSWMKTGHTKYPESLEDFRHVVLHFNHGDTWDWENIWSQLEYLPLTKRERELVGLGREEKPYATGTPLSSVGVLEEHPSYYNHGMVGPDGRRYEIFSGKLVGLWGPYREASQIEMALGDLREVALTSGDKHLADQLDDLLKWRNPRTRLQPCGPLLEFEYGVVPYLDKAAEEGFCSLYDTEAEGHKLWNQLAPLREFYRQPTTSAL